ncbi:hypothetical protein BCR44DRAFT_84018 [Catenaria anguillulae PL171]|uniref:Uncharacterized protein n=1 Tax=Catenaria anguillulae PL171 TaxID=765915 RepID=A0A1Y2HHZ5_9FUNG|nr:hypothetical protein BCR44DRAFT_84018 [Catenaria anguillulae PL171]
MLYLPWDDWKSFNMTIMLVWMSVNSIIANNYLIRLRSTTRTIAKSLSRTGAGSGLGSGVATANGVVPSSSDSGPSSGANEGMVRLTPFAFEPGLGTRLSLLRNGTAPALPGGQGCFH